MCGLFGMFNYESKVKLSTSDIISSLGEESCERGTDATGIAYFNGKDLKVRKAPKPAYKFSFKLPLEANIIMGHVRLTTQGDEKKNHNNHPFKGEVKGPPFVLAHNGIIYNDKELRSQHKLPDTKIETDSYVAVQLLEKSGQLTPNSIGDMVEKLEGSYCFTILDSKKNLHLVKGNNPLTLIHHKKMGVYFYASTDQILWRGIVGSELFDDFKKDILSNSVAIEEICLNDGDILTVKNNGETELNHFSPRKTCRTRLFGQGTYLTTMV